MGWYNYRMHHQGEKIGLFIKVNKQYPLLVIAIDKDKGYVDLSTKFLSEDDKIMQIISILNIWKC